MIMNRPNAVPLLSFSIIGCFLPLLSPAKDLTGKTSVGLNVAGLFSSDGNLDNTVYVGGTFDYGLSQYFAVGLESGYHSFNVNVTGRDLGDLRGIPLLADFIVRVPLADRWVPYGLIGLGVVFWDFAEGDLYKDMGISVDVDPSFAAKFAIGCDYFMTDDLALSLELAYVISEVELKARQGDFRATQDGNTDYGEVGIGLKYFF